MVPRTAGHRVHQGLPMLALLVQNRPMPTGPAMAPPRRPTTALRGRRGVPAFALYGETRDAGIASEGLHIEPIQSRSRLYHWEIDAHLHRGLHQVVWVARGSAAVDLDGMHSRCEAPAAIAIPPGVVHAFRFAPDTEGYVLTVDPRALVEGDPTHATQALQTLFAAPRVLALDAQAGEVQRTAALLAELLAEFLAPRAAGTPVPLWLARAVLWRLAQLPPQAPGGPARPQRALFARFLALVETHHLEHWPIGRYAAQLGLSPQRLNRLARAETGQSAQALVHERLLREACRRLIYIAAPVSRLAYELGFDDPAYFCRFFKLRTGLAPSAWREHHGARA
jgi:AraC family transcriptional activator of pobA